MVADTFDPADRSPGDDVTTALWLAEQTASAAVMQRLVARGFDDLTPELLAVACLLDPGETSRAVLARQAGMQRRSLNRLLRLLMKRGYVEEIDRPNGGRTKLVRHAERGAALSSARREIFVELQTIAARTLGTESAVRLHQHLDRIRSLFSSIAIGPHRGAPRRRQKTASDDREVEPSSKHIDCSVK